MAEVLTTKELEELREDLKRDEEGQEYGKTFLKDARRLLATLDAVRKELTDLKRKMAHSKGSHF
jgi:hypothetical protein